PSFSEDQVNEAKLAIRGIRSLMHSTSIDQVPLDQRKALSSFSFGSSGFILAPEQSNTILSCLVDVTDIAGLMNNVNISGAGIKFFVDNEIWDVAAWACESSCFANNPTKMIGDGLGELEIKPESLRYIVCSTRELLEDSSVNIEMWLLDKARRAFAYQINDAILTGDGFGKPMGILNPQAGISDRRDRRRHLARPVRMAGPNNVTLASAAIVARRRRVLDEPTHLGAVFDNVGRQRPADHGAGADPGRSVPAWRRAGGDRQSNAGRCARLDARSLRQLEAGLHGRQSQGGDDDPRPLFRRLLRTVQI